MRYVLVAGEGETSRENVEAILEDYFYTHKGEPLTMVVPFYRFPSRGQVYAVQMAKDNKAEVVVYATESARMENIEKTSAVFNDYPIEDAVALVAGKDTSAYILWSDEGNEAFEALEACKAKDVQAYDLTAGGMPITSPEKPAKAPISTPEPKDEAKPLEKAVDPFSAESMKDLNAAIELLLKLRESLGFRGYESK